MSLEYKARRKSVRSLVENQCGAECVAKVFARAGLPTNARGDRIPYAASEEQAKHWGQALDRFTTGTAGMVNTHDAWEATADLHDDTLVQFEGWINRWAQFLNHCGGYQAE